MTVNFLLTLYRFYIKIMAYDIYDKSNTILAPRLVLFHIVDTTLYTPHSAMGVHSRSHNFPKLRASVRSVGSFLV